MEPDFNMYRTLAVLLLLGSYLGRIISCFLPLVPTWIDVLLAGGGMVYVGTLGTPQGDLARCVIFLLYLLHTVKAALKDAMLIFLMS